MIKCPHCGAENPEGAEFCDLCLMGLGLQNAGYKAEPPAGEVSAERNPVETGEPGLGMEAPPVSEEFEQWRSFEPSRYPYAKPPPPFERLAGGTPGKAFSWGGGLLFCVYVAAIAGMASMVLEFILGFLAGATAYKGHFTLAYLWMLLALLIPCCASAFYVGYIKESYGWALGAVTVFLWAFLFRTLYSAIIGWLITGSFHIATPFDRIVLAFNFFLFIPLGFFLGWLGEKRATTGLKI